MRKLLCLYFLILPCLAYGQVTDKLDTLQQEAIRLSSVPEAVTDSLKVQQQIDSLQHLQSTLDTLALMRQLDSLQKLELPDAGLQMKIDSVQDLLDVSSKANRQINRLNREINNPLEAGRDKLQAKIDKVSNPKEVDAEGLSEFKEHSGLDVNTDLPRVEGIKLDGVGSPDLPGVEVPTGELPGLAAPDFPGIQGLDDIRQGIGKAENVAGQAGEYTRDMAKLGEGKLNEVEKVDQYAGQQFRQSEAGKAFQQQAGESESGLGEMQQLTGRDYVKENAKEKVYAAATDHFAGQQEKLNKASSQMNKYKGRYEKVRSVKDMPKGFIKLNPLKDKPWQERLVMGSLWQFGRQEQYLVDFGPTLAWRFTDKLSAGGGFQYRLTVSPKHKPWVNSSDKVLGYFIFADFNFKKGFFARLTYEDLHTAVPRFNASKQVERTDPGWVKGFSVGIGKRYGFYKRLKGYTLLQYNVLHRYQETPYNQPVQAKMGFYIVGKKLKKKKQESE